MKKCRARVVVRVSILVAYLILTPITAWAAEPTPAELQKKIDALQTQIDDLKAQHAQSAKLRDEQATTRAVVDDAERRSRVVDPGSVRGSYSDGKLIFRTENGNFSVRPWLQLQIRQTTTFREDGK